MLEYELAHALQRHSGALLGAQRAVRVACYRGHGARIRGHQASVCALRYFSPLQADAKARGRQHEIATHGRRGNGHALEIQTEVATQIEQYLCTGEILNGIACLDFNPNRLYHSLATAAIHVVSRHFSTHLICPQYNIFKSSTRLREHV